MQAFYINNILWQIVYVTPSDSRLMRSDYVYTLGVTDSNDKAVYISNAIRGNLLRKVITHEIVHCISFSYNLDIPMEIEEYIADYMANYGRETLSKADYILDGVPKRKIL